jgi:hypothetical protein
MITPAFSSVKTSGTQAVVTGQRLAKASSGYPPWERAKDAARWFRGELAIKPTAKLAADTFGVSITLVAEACEWLGQREQGKRHHPNGGSTTGLSDSAVERIVVEIGPERILRVVDKLTSPELPLAAE